MELSQRLQIKPGTAVMVVGKPADGPDLDGLGQEDASQEGQGAEAVIAFVSRQADLATVAGPAVAAARADRLAWIAYPKGGQLGTDLNRDRLAAAAAELGVQPVRQVSIDATWSALRFRPA